MSLEPDQIWWSAAELAEAGLPDLPTTKRRVNALADRCGWAAQKGLARRREGRGGGWEYHWTLLPRRAQQHLLTLAVARPVEAERMGRDEAWAYFEALPESVRSKARQRLEVVQLVEALERGGLTRDQSVRDAAVTSEASARTIWNWLAMIEGVRPDDRLPFLAPRHRAARRESRATVVDPDFGALIKSDYLRPEQPSLTSVYDRAYRVARRSGIATASLSAIRRWLDREVSEVSQLLARRGVDYVKSLYPPQQRDKTAMHALEAVNGDFHRFDVFVAFPGRHGRPAEIIRPQMVAFQDVYSGRILSWRVDVSANSHAVQLCLGDLIEDWGIPEHVLLDNGREFAAKTITGGSRTRFRFKAREDDIPGLLTTLGCTIHWATPYSGQSKPIERAFRDLCDRVAKHPAFAGAYTGNLPTAKPENYGERAVPLEAFLSVLTEEIEHHNTRRGRRSEVAFGRSFAEVFDESYAVSPIRKATAEQRRLWLMGAEGIRANSRTGHVMFQGNRYWAEFMHEHRGQKIVARFDQADLWSGLHIYALTGEYLGHAPCLEASGFFDVGEARAHSKARGDWLKAERATLAAHRSLTAAELGRGLDAAAPMPHDPADLVEAKVVRMIPSSAPARPAKQADAAFEAEVAETLDNITSIADRRKAAPVGVQGASDFELYRRVQELEALAAQGEALTDNQRRWLAGFKTSPEYLAISSMVEDFGEGFLSK